MQNTHFHPLSEAYIEMAASRRASKAVKCSIPDSCPVAACPLYIYHIEPSSEVAQERLSQELVSTEGEHTANEDSGVEPDAGRGAVRGGRRCAGGCGDFGLGVTLLFSR